MFGNLTGEEHKLILKQYRKIYNSKRLRAVEVNCACYYMYIWYWFVRLLNAMTIVFFFHNDKPTFAHLSIFSNLNYMEHLTQPKT